MHPIFMRLCSSGIGILIGIELSKYFEPVWFFGPFMGMVAGYLLYDIPNAVTSTKRAYNDVIGWEPDWRYWRVYWRVVGYLFLMVLNFALIPAVYVGVSMGAIVVYADGMDTTLLQYVLAKSFFTFCIVTFAGTLMFFFTDEAKTQTKLVLKRPDTLERRMRAYRRKMFRDIAKENAVTAIRATPWFIGVVAGDICTGVANLVGRFLSLLWRFVVRSIHYMHSRQREQVVCDVLLGSSIGYAYDSTFIGLAVGFAFAGTTIVLEKAFVKHVPIPYSKK